MTATRSREIHLKRRPVGLPTEDDFALVDVTLPEPSAGEVLVRNHYLSVDPYMRGRMYDRPSYVPPFQVGQVLEGGCVGQVIASRGKRGFSGRRLRLKPLRLARVLRFRRRRPHQGRAARRGPCKPTSAPWACRA